MMKRIANAILMVLIITIIIIPKATVVEAKVMNDLYVERNALIAKKEAAENKKELNAEETIRTQKEIATIANQITKTNTEIKETQNEIKVLDGKITEKNVETKELMRSNQITSGKLEYLEYLFKSVTLADFIHRMQTVETLSKHNEEVIVEMEDLINENTQLAEDLKNKETRLLSDQKNLRVKANTLTGEKAELNEITVDVDEDIEAIEVLIAFYEAAGCLPNENIKTCTNQLPPDTRFWRPVERGYQTSAWGYRTSPYVGFHAGKDIGVTQVNIGEVNVYAAANGKVIYKTRYARGGNVIYIKHNIDGKIYTTNYLHLRVTYVNMGDIVSKDTIIGQVGGNNKYRSQPGYTPWDPRTTGMHLHFGLALGEWVSYSSFSAHSVDPNSYINFPSGRTIFYNRTREY